MSAHTTTGHATSFTRRSMLKSLAGGAVAATLLATGRIADASRPRANRETGSAPVISGLSGFTGDAEKAVVPTRFERRSPE